MKNYTKLLIVLLSVVSLNVFAKMLPSKEPVRVTICQPFLEEKILQLKSEIKKRKDFMRRARFTPEGYKKEKEAIAQKEAELEKLEEEARTCYRIF